MDTEEKIDPDYIKGFNLAYTLETHGGENHYKDLMSLYEDNPAFKQGHLYQGMEAGKKQAEKEKDKELSDMYKDDLVNKYAENRNETLNQPKKDKSERPLSNEQEQPIEDFEKREAKGLTDKQLKELETHDKWMEESKERGEFKDATRKIKEQAGEAERLSKLSPEELERQKLKDAFMKKGKGDKDHSI